MSWDSAVARCDELTSGDHVDWRLPTISELRSIVRGCPVTMTGGACPVTDDCLDWDACWANLCNADCDAGTGPGLDGCFWDSSLGSCLYDDPTNFCGAAFWSSSTFSNSQDAAYNLFFYDGSLRGDFKVDSMQARCVRNVD